MIKKEVLYDVIDVKILSKILEHDSLFFTLGKYQLNNIGIDDKRIKLFFKKHKKSVKYSKINGGVYATFDNNKTSDSFKRITKNFI